MHFPISNCPQSGGRRDLYPLSPQTKKNLNSDWMIYSHNLIGRHKFEFEFEFGTAGLSAPPVPELQGIPAERSLGDRSPRHLHTPLSLPPPFRQYRNGSWKKHIKLHFSLQSRVLRLKPYTSTLPHPTAPKIRLDLNRWEKMRVERTGMNHEEQRETISQVLLYFTNMSEANGLSDSPSHDLLQSAQRALRNRNTGWVSTISQTPRQ